MSLFKTRELWSTSCDNDLFDLGCLKVANLGVNKNKFNSIIIGSYNGFLRIYNPSEQVSKENTSDSFKAHDLVCEMSLPAPIIQIEIGRFSNASNKNLIAVLMPKKLAIYEAIAYEEGNIEHGNQFSLKIQYEHLLQRTAYNMCKGPFGGYSLSSQSPPHEYICVQSMDGMLSVFEYESFSLSCFLPKVLIPGPLKYMPKTDSFITVSSSWELESYRYQVLASSAKTYERNQDNTGGVKLKKILPEYTYNLGEAAIDIEIINHQTSSSGQSVCSILILGERNLYCLSDTCVLKYMKKFDYNPSCFCAYQMLSPNAANSNSINFIIATHSKLLYVCEDVKVKWAAQVDQVPVQLVVSRINDLNGVIVWISEDGKLKCSYLGTEPAFINPILKDDSTKEFNFQSAENEYKSLQGKIKSAIMNTGTVVTNKSMTGLILNVEIPNRLDQNNSGRISRDTELKDPLDSIPSITCKLQLKSAEFIQNVKLNISCTLPIVAVPDTAFYSSIGSVPYDQEVCFYMKTKHIPCNLEVNVCATYSYSTNGAIKITESKFRLPLKLIMKSGQQMNSKMEQDDQRTGGGANDENKKNYSGLKKITLESNKPCVNLSEIFPEFSASYIPANGNIISAQMYGHANINISIQCSKSGVNRYRFQSENYETLWIILQEFVLRLHTKSQEILLNYQEILPTDDFRFVIDRHLELRQSLERHKENLEKCCVQFRAIQKRLLAKFKDKSPTSLDNMDVLLDATYRQINSVADYYLSTQKELSLETNILNCFSSLYVLLVSLTFKFNKEHLEILESVMTTQIGDTTDLGWEEIVNAAVSNLTRTALTKSSKDLTNQPQLVLKMPTDSNKLDKQIRSFVSKLENGASMISSIYLKKDSIELNKTNETKSNTLTKTNNDLSEIESQKVIKKPVVKSRATMGEDYDDEEEAIRKPFGSTNLPSFEDLQNSKSRKKDFDYDQ